LQVFNIVLIPIASTDPLAVEAKRNPQGETAFVLNLNEHWYTLRKFGQSEDRWYDLNSMSSSPKHVSKMYLGMLLEQMETEGYSIFVAKGDIPETEADQIAKMIPIPPPDALKPLAKNDSDSDLEKALKLSRGEVNPEEDDDLLQALKASMADLGSDSKTMDLAIAASLSSGTGASKRSCSPAKNKELSPEEIRRKRLEKFG
jgi:Ataxin-3